MLQKALCPIMLAASAAVCSNVGDFYDNRDNGHARLDCSRWPGVTSISTGYSFQSRALRDSVVVGNASLAYVSGPLWASLSRGNYMTGGGPGIAYAQYRSNNIYWHPEHSDNKQSDYFHGMMPSMGVSQGSSGSELDELGKWFDALNAFNADVKAALKSHGTLMSVIQMISRRTRVASDELYLGGAAHPSAFDDAANAGAMKTMAAGITVATLPPFAAFRVAEETYEGSSPTTHFGVFASERYWDTPVSVARLFVGAAAQKRAVLVADSSFDINRKPLTYHWRLLRGDPAKVTIKPLNADSSRVEVTVGYHPKASFGAGQRSNLVVVGLFVHNGSYYSAPAFFTSYTLDNEARSFDPATGRLSRIVYNGNYVFPLLAMKRTWDSDSMLYDAGGALSGWRRRKADSTWYFVKEGYLVVARRAGGVPDSVKNVTYQRDAEDGCIWKTAGAAFAYKPTTAAGGAKRAATVTRTAAAPAATAFWDLMGRSLGRNCRAGGMGRGANCSAVWVGMAGPRLGIVAPHGH